jgi:hypothetical protein
VAAVVALDALYSYKALITQGARYPASVYLFNVLRNYDLTHVIAVCAPRPVYLLPVDGCRQSCARSEVMDALLPASEAFSLSGVKKPCFKVAASADQREITQWLDTVLEVSKTVL